MKLTQLVAHLLEVVSSKPMLHRKDLTHRYGVDESTIDRWHTSGVLPKATYLRGCTQPLWKPFEIAHAESTTPALKRAISRLNGTKRN